MQQVRSDQDVYAKEKKNLRNKNENNGLKNELSRI